MLDVASLLGMLYGGSCPWQAVVEIFDVEANAPLLLGEHEAALDGVHGCEDVARLRASLVLDVTDDVLRAVVETCGQVAVPDVIHVEGAVVLAKVRGAHSSICVVQWRPRGWFVWWFVARFVWRSVLVMTGFVLFVWVMIGFVLAVWVVTRSMLWVLVMVGIIIMVGSALSLSVVDAHLITPAHGTL